MLLPASRIVGKLQGPVATPRSEAGVIVTERGAADLRGRTLKERERLMRELSGTR
jgi:acetyl-CoA hydrolase